ncbi:benzoate/H(+) symporter BenE family transporter [Tabrizicola oligotrophica]|uniref:Benzoate/H(+) symporter BenE family transporter n=1 Tax=Tabrizicola oligotrophica TaxID=2710650 RepID=A0A6M0QY39_9RHOB|nr:benzoate/H(+) symporter BenE family transporter [Tabrizicola oligotrophica]NEY91881.1 benzoate/H(+) symporter BenE family transporter [Tabrizicola oligotrophica]
MQASVISAALVAALVGYGSTIALVLSAAAAVGATAAQAGSWVFAICLAKAAGSALLSLWKRVPVVLAWSTPGAALIAATSGISMPEAVGAFVLAGLLIAATGAIRPLGRLVALIPDGVAAGMLAGVLLPFCLKGAGAAQALPALVFPMVAVFALVRLKNPALAVLAALGLGLVLAFGFGQALPPAASLPLPGLPLPSLTVIAPELRLDVLLGLGVPLYLVTMASQNLPGFATLRAHGYEPPVRAGLVTTGILSAISGLFGAHTTSMAAITAAICMGPDTHPEPHRRWMAGVVYAGFWAALGLGSPAILSVLTALPPALMVALVALALLGPLTGALSGAFAMPETRFAATVTLAVTASGVAAFGIGAAFWGLVAGLVVQGMEKLRA